MKKTYNTDELLHTSNEVVHFQLILSLQRTIIASEILDIHFNYSRKFFKNNSDNDLLGMSFNNIEQGLSLNLGEQSQNTVIYNVEIESEKLGKVVWYFEEPVTNVDDDFKVLLNILTYPLRNAIEHAFVIEKSLTDHLTGLGNRKSFELDVYQELLMKKRVGGDVSVLLLDLDKFKQVNDQLGHIQGDILLQEIAKTIKHLVRESDMVYRYGGDEFIIILRNTDSTGAVLLAGRIKKGANDALKTYNKKIVDTKLSISVGVSMLSDVDAILSILERADNALYQAKKHGGNHIYVVEDTPASDWLEASDKSA